MNKNQKIFNVIGLAALVLCVFAFVLTKFHGEIFNKKYVSDAQTNLSSGVFEFEDDELVYDGQGELDLMEGVHAYDSEGRDITDRVSAVITAEGTKGRKLVRYSFEDGTGRTVTKKRTLVLRDYKGPSLEVSNSIKINGKNLKDIIGVLKASGELEALDGYNKDITSSVTCFREKLYSGTYKMTFSVTNEFGDSISKNVDVFITGDVNDPEIEIAKDHISLSLGERFDPMNLVTRAFDGNIENKRDLEIEEHINFEKSGTYSVIYRMYNSNRTAVATKKLTVIIED